MPAQVTAEEARDILRARGHDARDLVTLTGGLWSTAFAFREGDRALVVRFHERRDDLEKDRYAQRWVSPRLRTPRVTAIGESPKGAYGISERVSGPRLDDLDEAGMRAVLPDLFATMDALCEADVSGSTGYGLWHGDGNAAGSSWRDFLGDDALARKRADLVGTPVGTDAFDKGAAAMRELVAACPEERHVAHQDLLNFNVIASPDGIVLLDWGASIYGDFLYDAALLTLWWPWYGERWGGIDIRAELERHYRRIGLDIPHFAERLRCYELHLGLDHIGFQAGMKRWDDAAWTARRTAELAASIR